MSYNIDNWKTKKLENLILPMSAFYESKRTDWHPKDPVIEKDGQVRIKCGCGQYVIGDLKEGFLHVTKIDMAGEGSGTFMRDIFENVLKKSKGILEAVAIWEGGDSITRITVVDGDFKEEGIEL